jgi:hypothetical protein
VTETQEDPMTDWKFHNPYMSKSEAEAWHRGDVTTYGEYTVKKQTQVGGYWDAPTRSLITAGWVVTKGGCNAIPGAGWCYTKDEAMQCINVLMVVGDDNAKAFHGLMGALRLNAKIARNQQAVADAASAARVAAI